MKKGEPSRRRGKGGKWKEDGGKQSIIRPKERGKLSKQKGPSFVAKGERKEHSSSAPRKEGKGKGKGKKALTYRGGEKKMLFFNSTRKRGLYFFSEEKRGERSGVKGQEREGKEEGQRGTGGIKRFPKKREGDFILGKRPLSLIKEERGRTLRGDGKGEKSAERHLVPFVGKGGGGGRATPSRVESALSIPWEARQEGSREGEVIPQRGKRRIPTARTSFHFIRRGGTKLCRLCLRERKGSCFEGGAKAKKGRDNSVTKEFFPEKTKERAPGNVLHHSGQKKNKTRRGRGNDICRKVTPGRETNEGASHIRYVLLRKRS